MTSKTSKVSTLFFSKLSRFQKLYISTSSYSRSRISRIHIFKNTFSIPCHLSIIIAFRKLCPQNITDQYTDIRPCFFFLAPVIEFMNPSFDRCQQTLRKLFDFLDFFFGQRFFRHQVKHRQFFIAVEPFFYIAFLLLIEIVHMFHQILKDNSKEARRYIRDIQSCCIQLRRTRKESLSCSRGDEDSR